MVRGKKACAVLPSPLPPICQQGQTTRAKPGEIVGIPERAQTSYSSSVRNATRE